MAYFNNKYVYIFFYTSHQIIFWIIILQCLCDLKYTIDNYLNHRSKGDKRWMNSILISYLLIDLFFYSCWWLDSFFVRSQMHAFKCVRYQKFKTNRSSEWMKLKCIIHNLNMCIVPVIISIVYFMWWIYCYIAGCSCHLCKQPFGNGWLTIDHLLLFSYIINAVTVSLSPGLQSLSCDFADYVVFF